MNRPDIVRHDRKTPDWLVSQCTSSTNAGPDCIVQMICMLNEDEGKPIRELDPGAGEDSPAGRLFVGTTKSNMTRSLQLSVRGPRQRRLREGATGKHGPACQGGEEGPVPGGH